MIYVFLFFFIFCPYVKHPKSITIVNNQKLCAKQINPCMGVFTRTRDYEMIVKIATCYKQVNST